MVSIWNNNGFNINNMIDITKTANDFVNYFFNKIKMKSINSMITDNVLKEYTIIKYNNVEYKENSLLELLDYMSKFNINITNIESISSGSRRIDISVCGEIKPILQQGNIQYLYQTFALCNVNSYWYIKSSLLIIV